MLRNLSRLATTVCRQRRIDHVSFESLRALASTSIKMPSLSPTMTEGTIVKWLKKEGEEIVAGDALCEIQTDKATMTLDTEDEGILAKILLPDNSTDIKVGKLIAIMVDKGEDWKNVEAPQSEEQSEAKASSKEKKSEKEKAPPKEQKDKQPPSAAKASSTEKKSAKEKTPPNEQEEAKNETQSTEQTRYTLGPAARALVEHYDIDPSKVQGTGPHGVVMKSDVQKFIDSNQLKTKSRSEGTAEKKPAKVTPSTSESSKGQTSESGRRYHDIELSSIRRAIAKRLTMSKTTIPHQYMSITSNVDELLKLRKQMISDPKATVKVSVNDFIIKAAAYALRQVPQMNAIYDRDQFKIQSTVDISVAVATESGLITPIVFNADTLSIQSINGQVRQLAGKAKDGKLKPSEFQGGTFTISNLGMFGIKSFSAVINPPQIGILAIGQNSFKCSGEEFRPENQLIVTLSYDARACEVQSSALFLQAFRSCMENPKMLAPSIKSESFLNF